MEALITWRYFLIPEDKFDQIKPAAEELDGLRNRELTEEEAAHKEELIARINEKAKEIAKKIQIYTDDEEGRDGTVVEELIYRMDEAWELHSFRTEFYFKFLVYATPQELQKQKDTIEKIFDKIADKDLLKREFIGKWIYLDRARVIFKHLRELYQFAFENNCGIIKTDSVTWKETEIDREEENPTSSVDESKEEKPAQAPEEQTEEKTEEKSNK